MDQYSRLVETDQNAKQGIITNKSDNLEVDNYTAELIVQNILPRKSGDVVGYTKVADAGNRLWSKKRMSRNLEK